MTTLRCIIISLFAAFLAGCMTVAPHSLSDADLHAYRVVDVVVEGVEVIRSWPSEEDRYLATHSVDPETANRIRTEPAFAFPAVKSHLPSGDATADVTEKRWARFVRRCGGCDKSN